MNDAQQASRRAFLQTSGWGSLGLAAGMTGCAGSQPADSVTGSPGSSLRPLKACFSNAGLQSTWCAAGKKAVELWGKLLNIDIEWVDGEFDPEKQRNKIDAIVHRDWDFCCFQAVQIDSLAAPVQQLKERQIPVISMDTLLVEMDKMRETGVWCEVTNSVARAK